MADQPNRNDLQTDPLLTPREAARVLRKSVSFLAKARMTGTGPEYVQLGRNILYRLSKLIVHLEKKSRTSTSQRRSAPPKAAGEKCRGT